METMETMKIRCRKCGKENPIDAKCCRNSSCMAVLMLFGDIVNPDDSMLFGDIVNPDDSMRTGGHMEDAEEPYFVCVKCGAHSYTDQCDCSKCGADLRLYGAWVSMPEAEGLSYQAVKEQEKAGLRVTLTDIDWERYKEKMPDKQTPESETDPRIQQNFDRIAREREELRQYKADYERIKRGRHSWKDDYIYWQEKRLNFERYYWRCFVNGKSVEPDPEEYKKMYRPEEEWRKIGEAGQEV